MRTKTDGIHAALIARFCRLHEPEPRTPPAPEIRLLQGLVRRQHGLMEMRVAEENRRGAPIVPPAVLASIEAMLEHLERDIERVAREIEQLFDDYPTLRRQRELLTSIPGIAETTAARTLGELPNLTEFRNVKAVAAFAGLSPHHYQSASIQYHSRLARPAALSCGTRFTFQRSQLRQALQPPSTFRHTPLT